VEPLRITVWYLLESKARRLSKLAVGLRRLQLSNRLQNSQNLANVAHFRSLTSPLFPIDLRRIVPMTPIGLIRGARFDKSAAGWVVLKWKFCQLQSGLQEGAAAPSDDLRPRPLQWWRVRQSGTAGISLSNRRAAVILRHAARSCDRLKSSSDKTKLWNGCLKVIKRTEVASRGFFRN